MSPKAKFLAMLAIIAVLALAFWFGFFHENRPLRQVKPAPIEIPSDRTNTSSFFSRPGTRSHGTNGPVVQAPAPAVKVMNDWEARVDEILRDDSELDEKARQMLELFPSFPEAGQVETAQHIANLLADEDYDKFGCYLTNSKTPVDVQDVVLADVLNRPNGIKLPLLLETARNPENAKAGEAKEILELYLEEDYGTNWDKWRQETEKWLKENPD